MTADKDTQTLMTLRVTRAEPAADGIQLLEFRNLDGADLPPFTPGAHLSVRVPSGALRNYSLCNDAGERDRYVIAVKRDERGRGGSVSLVDGTKPGDTIDVSAPRNLFELVTDAPAYIFVAGDIGITPILSMIRGIGSRPFSLAYLTRNAAGTAFLADLSGHTSVTVHHDEGDPDRAFDLWPLFEEPTAAHVYCCGPRPLMDAVRDMTGHWPEHQVHFEDFGSDLVRPRDTDTPFSIRLASTGAELDVPVGSTILEILRTHGHKAPAPARAAPAAPAARACSQASPDHRDLVLTEAERRHEIMICVSRARSDLLVLDL